MMTPRQIELARHAIGLSGQATSYRNSFVAGPGHADYAEWQAMVENGHAVCRGGESLPFSGSDLFAMTAAGAQAVLRRGEKLDPKVFPDIVQDELADLHHRFFHVTPVRNLDQIMSEGLVPKLGVRSRRGGEVSPAIFFFPTIEDTENACMNWVAGEFADSGKLALLEAAIPMGAVFSSPANYERVVTTAVAPEHIRILSHDLMAETGFAHLVSMDAVSIVVAPEAQPAVEEPDAPAM
jgi:hypothetical protein